MQGNGRGATRQNSKCRRFCSSSGDDKLVDADGAREFAAAMPPERCTIKIYPALFHEVFNETEPDRTQVLKDLCDWIQEQTESGSR